MAFTKADSCVPLIRSRVSNNKMTNAGAFMIPDVVTPLISDGFKRGMCTIHRVSIRPAIYSGIHSRQWKQLRRPRAYSMISAQPMIQAIISPIVT